MHNCNVNAPQAAGFDRVKAKETTFRVNLVSRKLPLALAFFISILATLALSGCEQKTETTEPSGSPPKPLATPLSPSTITESPAAASPPEPSATSPPDYTGWDTERGLETQESPPLEATPPPEDIPSPEPPPPPEIKPEYVEETTSPPTRPKAKEKMPEFDWPPPPASAFETVPRKLLLGSKEHASLGDAAAALDHAFRKAGYGEKSYYTVPGGFAMASRIEQINQDGTPKDSVDRWSVETPRIRSFRSYLDALFLAPPGHYRVIVFVVTSERFSQSGAKISAKDAEALVKRGSIAVTEDIASQNYTSAHMCTALIYEFKRIEGQNPKFVDPSEITGQTHLERAGLLAALKRR